MRWVCWGQGTANKTMQVRVCARVCAGQRAGGTGSHLPVTTVRGGCRLLAFPICFVLFYSFFPFFLEEENQAPRRAQCQWPPPAPRRGEGLQKPRRAVAAAAAAPAPGTPTLPPPRAFRFVFSFFSISFSPVLSTKTVYTSPDSETISPVGRSRHQTLPFALGWFPFFRFIFLFFPLPNFFFFNNNKKKATDPKPSPFQQGWGPGPWRGGLWGGQAPSQPLLQ